eukprot:TRINITY_DN42999_c0_g1_i1.p1 TRINITY_DN42999_c0_g1~~TRINITY_DN42999_c0_g1_i1.p1  ORF type:complete len:254 (+),score=45.42 TRINITY_DN42999_c0_g1_i1:2-763(+)
MFKAGFDNPLDALQFCLKMQVGLLHVRWPASLIEMDEFKENRNSSGKMIWRGLKVAMAMSTGDPGAIGRPIFEKVQPRSSSLNQLTKGGQILLCDRTWEALLNHKNDATKKKIFKDMIATHRGRVTIPGESSESIVMEALSKNLIGRHFENPVRKTSPQPVSKTTSRDGSFLLPQTGGSAPAAAIAAPRKQHSKKALPTLPQGAAQGGPGSPIRRRPSVNTVEEEVSSADRLSNIQSMSVSKPSTKPAPLPDL